MDLLRITARVAASTFGPEDQDEDSEDGQVSEAYGKWVADILEKHGGPGIYVRFDTGPFSPERSFSDENPNDHTNHLGIWAYLTSGGKEPRPDDFGWGSHYVTVLKGEGRILHTDAYSKASLEEDMAKVAEAHGEDAALQWAGSAEEVRQTYIKLFKEDKHLHDPERFEQIMSELSMEVGPFDVLDGAAAMYAKDTGKDSRAGITEFYVELGYSVIEDPKGVIDTAGNTALGLTPNSMSVVKRYVYQPE